MSPRAMWTLHKYYLRSQLMRRQFHAALQDAVAKHGDPLPENISATDEGFALLTFMDHWYAALFTAVEGYNNLALHDARVEELLRSPLFGKLRRYRIGTYHFRELYFDQHDAHALMMTQGAGEWVRELDHAVGSFLLARMSAIRDRSTTINETDPRWE